MLLYLDNCCFNRPFDNQSQLRIHLETEAKLSIQARILSGVYRLAWSYILDYENRQNPFRERREQIARWRTRSSLIVTESERILNDAAQFHCQGLRKMDALHLACAVNAQVDCFLTTDDGIIRKSHLVTLRVTDPIGFIKESAS